MHVSYAPRQQRIEPMATVSKTRFTPEDLLEIDDRPMPELVDGELLEREMGQEADWIASSIIFFLASFVRERNLGMINGGQGSYQIFPDDPNKVRIPDVSFTKKERIAKDGPAKGHGRVAPDLAIEVVSPNDKPKYISNKIRDFQAAGIPLIWIVYPETQTVEIHRIDGSTSRLQVGEFLEGEDVLPGFHIEVAALFT
jgi:Uma2 family endonuclease